jgi:DNA anti-recombination protein RmuC
MARRTVQTVDPLSAQSRTLALTAASELQQLKSDFQSDKAIKDGKIQTLEADKNDKDTRMNTAETKITTLENSATGIVDGGRADVQHLEATDINGGSASI